MPRTGRRHAPGGCPPPHKSVEGIARVEAVEGRQVPGFAGGAQGGVFSPGDFEVRAYAALCQADERFFNQRALALFQVLGHEGIRHAHQEVAAVEGQALRAFEPRLVVGFANL